METLTSLEVEIPVTDLELIRAALNSAYHYSMVVDLSEQYRKLTQRPQSSNLTKSLQNALTVIISYIEMGAPEEEASDE